MLEQMNNVALLKNKENCSLEALSWYRHVLEVGRHGKSVFISRKSREFSFYGWSECQSTFAFLSRETVFIQGSQLFQLYCPFPPSIKAKDSKILENKQIYLNSDASIVTFTPSSDFTLRLFYRDKVLSNEILGNWINKDISGEIENIVKDAQIEASMGEPRLTQVAYSPKIKAESLILAGSAVIKDEFSGILVVFTLEIGRKKIEITKFDWKRLPKSFLKEELLVCESCSGMLICVSDSKGSELFYWDNNLFERIDSVPAKLSAERVENVIFSAGYFLVNFGRKAVVMLSGVTLELIKFNEDGLVSDCISHKKGIELAFFKGNKLFTVNKKECAARQVELEQNNRLTLKTAVKEGKIHVLNGLSSNSDKLVELAKFCKLTEQARSASLGSVMEFREMLEAKIINCLEEPEILTYMLFKRAFDYLEKFISFKSITRKGLIKPKLHFNTRIASLIAFKLFSQASPRSLLILRHLVAKRPEIRSKLEELAKITMKLKPTLRSKPAKTLLSLLNSENRLAKSQALREESLISEVEYGFVLYFQLNILKLKSAGLTAFLRNSKEIEPELSDWIIEDYQKAFKNSVFTRKSAVKLNSRERLELFILAYFVEGEVEFSLLSSHETLNLIGFLNNCSESSGISFSSKEDPAEKLNKLVFILAQKAVKEEELGNLAILAAISVNLKASEIKERIVYFALNEKKNRITGKTVEVLDSGVFTPFNKNDRIEQVAQMFELDQLFALLSSKLVFFNKLIQAIKQDENTKYPKFDSILKEILLNCFVIYLLGSIKHETSKIQTFSKLSLLQQYLQPDKPQIFAKKLLDFLEKEPILREDAEILALTLNLEQPSSFYASKAQVVKTKLTKLLSASKTLKLLEKRQNLGLNCLKIFSFFFEFDLNFKHFIGKFPLNSANLRKSMKKVALLLKHSDIRLNPVHFPSSVSVKSEFIPQIDYEKISKESLRLSARVNSIKEAFYPLTSRSAVSEQTTGNQPNNPIFDTECLQPSKASPIVASLQFEEEVGSGREELNLSSSPKFKSSKDEQNSSEVAISLKEESKRHRINQKYVAFKLLMRILGKKVRNRGRMVMSCLLFKVRQDIDKTIQTMTRSKFKETVSAQSKPLFGRSLMEQLKRKQTTVKPAKTVTKSLFLRNN